jgi:hypothetical protein
VDELDRKIEEALAAEDRDLLARLGEPGPLGEWAAVYRGAMGRLAVAATGMAFALFFAALYCAWRFFGATEPLDAVRWGAGAGLLLLMIGYLKLWFWLRMESNRILREVKRLELQIARAEPRSREV